MSKRVAETFHFATLGELKEWIDIFKSTNLDTIHPNDSDWIILDWIEEELSDGSIVNNVSITTH